MQDYSPESTFVGNAETGDIGVEDPTAGLSSSPYASGLGVLHGEDGSRAQNALPSGVEDYEHGVSKPVVYPEGQDMSLDEGTVSE